MSHLPLLTRLLLLSYLAAQLAACSTTAPVREAVPASSSAVSAQKQLPSKVPGLANVVSIENAGDYATAAEIYLAAARSAPPLMTAALQFKAVSALYKANKHDQAAELGLSLLSSSGLSERQHNELGLLVAEKALTLQDAQQALQALSFLAPSGLAQRQQQLYFQYKADALGLPQQPASGQLTASFTPAQEEIIANPKIVAVLLPDTGAFAPAAKAIRNGLIAAFLENTHSDHKPEVRFYNSGELADQMNSAYDRAIAEGAQLIIGPLIKEHVGALALRESLPVPTLALNHIDLDRTLANLYLFALNPEQDAQQTADKALLDGHTHALTLSPQNAWGKRLSDAFAESWQQAGGKVAARQSFDPSGHDLATSLQLLLKLDESKARIDTLKRLVGSDLQAEPRPRRDIDVIFLAATPAQARQIRPHLRFINAENLPVYATSHIYTGHHDPTNDHDMDGILFGDMPWVLRPNATWDSIAAQWPGEAANFKRLYAFGFDSFNVIPHLRRLSADPGQQLAGQTGVLRITAQQQVIHQLLWAKFVAGAPVVQAPSP